MVVVVKKEAFNDRDNDETALTLGRRTTVAKRPMCFAAATASLRSISEWVQFVPPCPLAGMAGGRLRAQQHTIVSVRGRVHDHPDGWRDGRVDVLDGCGVR